MKHNFILMSDYYKQSHAAMYPEGTTKIVSYMTPRKTRIEQDKMVVMGVSGFCKEILTEMAHETFFNRNKEEVLNEVETLLNETLSPDYDFITKIGDLHDLGYLPIQVECLPEGTLCPMGVPFIRVTNTHKDFAWVVEFIESVMSSYVWYPSLIATIAREYKKVVVEAFDETSDGNPNFAISEFGFRGSENPQSGIMASVGFLTSFHKTATVPANLYINQYYNGKNCGGGMISTEHSVMCSNIFANIEKFNCSKLTAERLFLLKLLGTVYPTGNISVVMDSFDYYGMVKSLHEGTLGNLIRRREGTLFVRGDSGNPLNIVVDTVEILAQNFGYMYNSKGYKILPDYIRVIYGDSITIELARDIYAELENRGYAADNVALGAGSFSMQCKTEDGNFKPFTRDTFGIAMKATYIEVNGKGLPIQKDPKTDEDNFKKSHRGLVNVINTKAGYVAYECDTVEDDTAFSMVFIDGTNFEEDIKNIRRRIEEKLEV